MDLHYLLVSHQDSLTRAILPNVLPRDDRLSVAASPFDALALLRVSKLDAVLIAFDEDDQEAVVMCKTLRRRSNVPIVMLVNSTTRNQVTRGYRLGADAHIEIPCDPRIFRARVAALLRRGLGTKTETGTQGDRETGRGKREALKGSAARNERRGRRARRAV